MHTSQALRSSHFEYQRPESGKRVAFSAFCADYHDQDRVGVVSPQLEDGILHTAYALLALTTAFYDVQRASGSDFFIYPQHFAVIGQDPSEPSPTRDQTDRADRIGIASCAGRLDLTLDEAGIGGAWAWLDVWPASNWFTAPVTPAQQCSKRSSTSTSIASSGRRTSPPNAARSGNGKRGQRTPSPARLRPQDAEDAPQIRLLLQLVRADRRDLRRPAGRGRRSAKPRSPAGSRPASAGTRRPPGPPP